ncbi:ABATE domain-containing protein [Streptomyces sp. SID13031]|uniref:CGNR zinc finger domain-containing protein n=1 Tax=Streptomyces sp. SID13031 TaxID=2706046 RepID=UPI0013C694B0|nr:ABATE domain-containing protein [Streptomyces sp. SID13031]NEA33749.1 4-hydroxybenzoyl-CoA reductase [Streptomyces sp. SID13031]
MAVDLLAFPFIGGRTALNLAGTLGKRSTEKLERIRTPEDLTHWAELAGLGSIAADAADLEDARVLREALYRLTMTVLGRGVARPADAGSIRSTDVGSAASADVELVNAWAARKTPAPALVIRSGGLERADPGPTASAVLAAVARDGVDLLTGPDASSIRECEDPACTLLFVDTSRGHRRRWCSMNSCGARSKMRTLRSSPSQV